MMHCTIQRRIVQSAAVFALLFAPFSISAHTLQSDQWIIHFDQPGCNPQRITTLAKQSGYAINFVRRLSDGSCIVRTPHPLSRRQRTQLATGLAAQPSVRSAEPNLLLSTPLAPTQPANIRLERTPPWYLVDPQHGVHALTPQTVSPATPPIVAVLDNGVIMQHPQLKARLLPGYDMVSADPFSCPASMQSLLGCPYYLAADGDGRETDASDPGNAITVQIQQQLGLPASMVKRSTWLGTAHSGLIAASGSGKQGTLGIDRYARILPVRVSGRGGVVSDLADGIRWAAGLAVTDLPINLHPAKVLYIGVTAAQPSCPTVLQNAIDDVLRQSKVRAIVVGSGDGGYLYQVEAPANCRGTIAVASIDHSGKMIDASNYSEKVLLTAPSATGREPSHWQIPTLSNCSTTHPALTAESCAVSNPQEAPHVLDAGLGTSVSAAMVAGAVSRMLSVDPTLSANEVRDILTRTARPYPPYTACALNHDLCGAGILDIDASIEAARTKHRR